MSIDYESARPDDYVDGLYIGATTTLEHMSEIQRTTEERRKQRIINLILEAQVMRHLQDPWRVTGTEPIGKRAFDLGIENGVKETLIEEGLLTIAL